MIEPILDSLGDLYLRYWLPEDITSIRRIFLLLHGWTGDENTMWIFFRETPPDALVLAPRGWVAADPSGYGWFNSSQKLDTPLEAYLPAAENLFSRLDSWLEKNGIPRLPFDVIGFSQGAAMAGVLGALFPDRIGKTALLAGFLPPDISSNLRKTALEGRPFYIAHGSRDDIVPIRMAESSAAALSAAGAKVTFCSSDAGHKLSIDCARGLHEFLES